MVLLRCSALLAAGWLLPGLASAQTPDSSAAVATQQPALPTAAPVRPLLKLGTGLARGFEFGGFSGVALPLVLGAEHQLRPGWTLYGNAYSSFALSRYRRPGDRAQLGVRELGAELGVRRYYNQQKRQQRGRATGPFVGNYVALQTATSFRRTYWESRPFTYDYSALTAVWGLQRRLGSHGLLDAYVGAGLGNPRVWRYDAQTGLIEPRRRPSLGLELGVKLSLVR